MNTIVLKLVTGETVLAEHLEDEDSDNFYVKNPVLVFLMGDPSDPAQKPQVQFMPMRTFGNAKLDDDIVIIKGEHVIVDYLPSNEMAREYDEIYGVGLVAASPKEASIILNK
jgi:hypothetical protein